MPRLPDSVRLPRAWDTAAAALSACAHAHGDPRSVAELAAGSGLAFRVNVDAAVTLAGPHAWPWRAELPAAAERLGYPVRVVACEEPAESALAALARERAVALIRSGLEGGRPTLLWGVHAPEFGLVRGLDGDRLEVSGILDGVAPAELPIDELGRGDVPMLFALQLEPLPSGARLPADECALAALRAALLAGRGPCAMLAGFWRGLDAWAAVSRALESGAIDPAGLAYFAHRQAEARAAIAAFMPEAARALDVSLDAAASAYRRSAAMLGELAACHPFPPPPDTMMTGSLADQSRELVDEVARAEHAALEAIERSLASHRHARAARLTVLELAPAQVSQLFACTADLPLPLSTQADRCRDQERERLGTGLRALLLQEPESARTVGQLLYAPLAEARYPIGAEGDRWLVFCPWVSRSRRGRGLGARLFGALIERARAAGVDGLLALATTDERFLDPAGFLKHGFVEVGRRGELRLLELPLSERPSCARIVDPVEPPRGGPLPVVVRQAYNCPLLLATQDNLLAAAAELPLAVDTRDATQAEPAGVTVGGRPLLHGFVPVAALTHALRDAASRW